MENSGPKSALIVYASPHGQTERIAQFLGLCLRRAGLDCDELALDSGNDRPVPLTQVDLVVIGAPIYRGQIHRAARQLIGDPRRRPEPSRSALFTTSLAAAARDDQTRALPSRMVSEDCSRLGWQPAHIAHFAGTLAYREYGPLQRLLMRRLAQRRGVTTDTTRNHEFTDWRRVEAFAAALTGSNIDARSGTPAQTPAPPEPPDPTA